MSPASARRRSQTGVTLIEALVTFVILAVGLLGIISLQGVAKSAQHQSVQRSRAVILANDLLERIRINPAGVLTYSAGGMETAIGGGTRDAPAVDCASATCDAGQLATYDLWLWERSLDGATVTITDADATVHNAGGLIAPRACVRFSADAGMTRSGVVEVIIQWDGLREIDDAVADDADVCGDGDDAGEDGFRRQLVVSSFVIDEAEL